MPYDAARVQKELVEIERDKASGVGIEMKGDNLGHLVGVIKGPESSPYDGGTFKVDIEITPSYPFEPPKMRFITKVWHPNVSSQNGAICLDILKDQWSPALTLKTALLSVQALLSSPEPDDPQDAVVAKQYINEQETFRSTARYWTEAFAKVVNDDDKVTRLVEMGFGEGDVKAALAKCGGDENAALEQLCGGS
ncbi:Ubiquitin-conjugating enzyme E2 27 [Cymbomonas tetramitiformis]|uniref:E2 ubiquitin-conjugating enzyme n=1 Tax=Cymbomonas tetramitiformis TaxID=36881 RepID=A0AAE0FJE3_9CHLO|nr:Ubiquitin-conjugating enzyme E2 27 [Cymbomonas tetramitiformis]|eukprot:gene7875-9352_t